MIDIDRLADRHTRLAQRHPEFGHLRADAGVVIAADPAFIRGFSGQVTWATLLNLVARFYKGVRHIRLIVPPDVRRCPHVFLPNASMDIREASLQFLRQLSGNAFTLEEGAPSSQEEEWIWAYVGTPGSQDPRGISMAGQGWLAFVNDESWRGLPSASNPVGPMAAACFGAAEIYKALYPLREMKSPTRLVLSTFDYSSDRESNPSLPESLHLPRIYVGGAGAVGMAMLLLLNSLPAIVSGDGLHVVDDDVLDDTNLNRCLLALLTDIDSPKTRILEARLDTARLALKVHNSTWQSFVEMPEHRDDRDFERVVSCVDKYPARRALQYDRPPRVLLTAGTSDFLLSVSRHVLDDGLSCGLCYQAKEAETGCARATEGAQQAFIAPPDPSISFVSALAGVLLGAELLKEIVPPFREASIANTARVKLLTGAAKVRARAKDPSCNCSSKYVSRGYQRLWRTEVG